MRIAGQRTIGDVVILDLEGRADRITCSDEPRERVGALAAAGNLNVLLNMTSVASWDAGALGTMVRCYTLLSSQGGMRIQCERI